MGAAAVPIITTLVGAGASYAASRKVANDQDAIAADGIRRQAENQRQTTARLNQTLNQMSASGPAEERASAQQSYGEQLQRSRTMAGAGLAQRGISQQFDEMAGASEGQATGYAQQVADLMARIDAGGLQRQREGNQMADMGMDFDVLGGNIKGDEFLTRLRMGGVRRNPWLDALGGAAGVAGTYAAGGQG